MRCVFLFVASLAPAPFVKAAFLAPLSSRDSCAIPRSEPWRADPQSIDFIAASNAGDGLVFFEDVSSTGVQNALFEYVGPAGTQNKISFAEWYSPSNASRHQEGKIGAQLCADLGHATCLFQEDADACSDLRVDLTSSQAEEQHVMQQQIDDAQDACKGDVGCQALKLYTQWGSLGMHTATRYDNPMMLQIYGGWVRDVLDLMRSSAPPSHTSKIPVWDRTYFQSRPAAPLLYSGHSYPASWDLKSLYAVGSTTTWMELQSTSLSESVAASFIDTENFFYPGQEIRGVLFVLSYDAWQVCGDSEFFPIDVSGDSWATNEREILLPPYTALRTTRFEEPPQGEGSHVVVHADIVCLPSARRMLAGGASEN